MVIKLSKKPWAEKLQGFFANIMKNYWMIYA